MEPLICLFELQRKIIHRWGLISLLCLPEGALNSFSECPVKILVKLFGHAG